MIVWLKLHDLDEHRLLLTLVDMLYTWAVQRQTPVCENIAYFLGVFLVAHLTAQAIAFSSVNAVERPLMSPEMSTFS